MKTKKSFYISWILGLVFCIVGLVFFVIGWTGYGVSIFCILPVALGISTGILPDRKGAILGLSIALIFFFIGLLIAGLEGSICLLMAIPVIVPFLFLGYLIAHLIQKSRKNKNHSINISLAPILIFVFSSMLEGAMGDVTIKESVTTSIIVPHTAVNVYDKIIHVDTVSAEKGVLHYLGLPVPLNCQLTEEKVGGLRICEFEKGTIIETIKEFERGQLLKMDVTEFNLEGRSWLKFDEDIYEMSAVENGTKVSRTTTYFSELKPRAYWRNIEALTIEEEQDLVFRNLKKDLNEN